jgi:hypothetical protein
MTPRSLMIGIVAGMFALAILGCSLVGRAVDSATGGAASTLQAMQSELEAALATLPPEMDSTLAPPPAQLPSEGSSPESVDLGGTVTGNLSYPSEGVPALLIVAFDSLSLTPVASVDTAAGQSGYSLPLPQGVYVVVAYTLDGQHAAGYSAAVLCGLSVDCTDHTLIPVPVAGGLAADGIDPADWYAPEGTFPPPP